jgi:uncharacterized protein (DUF1501 family)
MSTFNRRDILRAGGVGAFLSAFAKAGVPAHVIGPIGNAPLAGSVDDPRVITIFLRGAQDGVHTIVPVGDSTYTTARPNLQPGTVPLPGSAYAALNAKYAALLPIYGAGHAAFLHQIGNPDGERSHFDEQQIYESAYVPVGVTDPLKEDGVIARLAGIGTFSPSTTAVRGASVSFQMQQFFRGFTAAQTLAHVRHSSVYTLGNQPIHARQRTSMQAHLNQAPGPTAAIEAHLDAVGEYVLASEAAISGLPTSHDAASFPNNPTEAAAQGLPATPAGYGFMSQCEQAYKLVSTVGLECQAVGIELGGWDTHGTQMAQRDALDPWLAHAIRSLYDLLVFGGFTNFVILVVTEFGRTNIENANLGTDHGVGGLMMAFGNRVNSGVYNCHNGSGLGRAWRELGTTPSQYTRYTNACYVARDFRSIYAELFHKLFGLTHGSGSQIATVIPGWTNTSYQGCFI